MPSLPDRVVVRAPATVNLHLAVGPLRPDGYHDLTSVFHALDLYDELELRPAAALTLTVDGPDTVPVDGTNLVLRAVLALSEHTGHDPIVALHLTKRIPVAAGCAGGSADAAAALVGCDALWGTGLSRDELLEIGATLGSDVPFSLVGGTALGTGRGEQLTSVLAHGAFSWVLALADGGLSTPDVYREIDRLREQGPVSLVNDPSAVLAALRSGDPAALGRALSNDLQAAAISLRPSLATVLDAGRDLGALGGIVSGSGPTVAFLCRDAAEAAAFAARLAAAGVCREAVTAGSPAHGAKVVSR
jgi:4-diphosphocytidyl-2-C-methyl-D-erythritol kinase